ncbi:MAG: hypothetical protein QNI99_22025 [Woeseiaceae bacterium]|nr:hypothetical protein [Woeseiaceae bacterium]
MSGCVQSNGGAGGTTDDPDGDGPATGLTTYARSFGGPGFDELKDLQVDENGGVWVLASFDGRPWLANLDTTGQLVFETSPAPETSSRQTEPMASRVATDGGAVFVGHTDSPDQGKNVVVQRQDADGNVLWVREFDTGDWDPLLNFDYVFDRPYAHDIPYLVTGDEDSGWFVLGDSVADLEGTAVDGSFTTDRTARSAFVAHLSDNGSLTFVERIAQISDDPVGDPDDRGTRFVHAVLVGAGTNSELAMLIGIDPYRGQAFEMVTIDDESDMQTLRLLTVSRSGDVVRGDSFEANSENDSVKLPWIPFTVDDDEVVFIAPDPVFIFNEADSGFAYDAAGVIVKLDANGRERWRYDRIANTSVPNDLSAMAQTTYGTTGESLLWIGGSLDVIPMLAAFDSNGDVATTCDLSTAFPFRGSVQAIEGGQGPSNELMRIFVVADDDRAPAFEALVDRNCVVLTNTLLQYPRSGLFNQLAVPSRDGFIRWVTNTEGPERYFVAERDAYTDVYNSSTGVAERRTRISNSDDYTENPDLAGLSVGRTPAGARIATITATTGQVRSVDAAGLVTRALSTDRDRSQPVTLSPPATTSGGTSYFRQQTVERLNDILQTGPGSDVTRVALPECYWTDSGAPVTPDDNCRDSERYTAMASSVAGGIDILGNGSVGNGRFASVEFLLNLQDDGSGEVRRFVAPDLRASSGPNVDGTETAFALDSARQDGEVVRLVRRGDLLIHFGTTPDTTWAIGDWPGIVRGAVIAHDGGVVMLMNFASNLFSIDPADENIALMKLNEYGETQWLRVYGTGGKDLALTLSRTIGGYVAAAESLGVDAVTPGTKDLWILQVGLDGRISSDAEGVEFCQAGLESINGSLLYESVRQSFGFTNDVAPLGEPRPISFPVEGEPIDFGNISTEQSSLPSRNTARQCIGSATNIQEDPFRPPRSVSVSVSGSGTVTSNPDGIDCGTNCSAEFGRDVTVTLSPTAATGWSFAGWSGDDDCTDGVVEPGSTNVSCTATFTEDASELGALLVSISPNDPALSNGVTSNPRGIACPDICAAEFPVGEMVTLTPVADTPSGWEFDGWTGDPNCNEGNVMIVGGPLGTSCTANFVQRTDTSTLTVIVNNNGEVYSLETDGGIPFIYCTVGDGTSNTCTADVTGDEINLRALPGLDTTDLDWTGCDGGQNLGIEGCRVTMNGDRTVTATFR